MRATLNIPDKLIAEVQELSGETSKTKAIVIAMQEYIRGRKVKKLLKLRGKIRIDYDWQEEEERELQTQKEREKSFER